MNRYIFAIIFLQLTLRLYAADPEAPLSDTLIHDTTMLSTGIEIRLKAGTEYRTNSRGLIVEGTPAHDIDLWTPGPMILFSQAGPVVLNESGRAIQGILGANTLIQCADNQFREFARDHRIAFNSQGLLVRGTPVYSISFQIEDQEFMSQPLKPISFHPNGKIHLVHPQNNIRLNTSNGGRIVISSQSWIELSETGHFLRGKLFRKYMGHRAGETIRMDDNGNIQ